MKITNTHSRILNAAKSEVAFLLNGLSSDNDRLWPHEKWVPMKFDRELSVGAVGGHGPIGYVVTEFSPGELVTFRFTDPPGFKGYHWFQLEEKGEATTVISHTIRMEVAGSALISWLTMIRPLHNALIEDSFDKAQTNLGLDCQPQRWSPWVKLLKRLVRKKPAKR